MSNGKTQRLALACALVVALAGCAPSLKGVRAEEVRQAGTKVTFGYGHADTYQALVDACADLRYSVELLDAQRRLITGTSPASLLADSEHFAIHVVPAEDGTTDAYFATVVSVRSQVWGEPVGARQALVRQAVRILSERRHRTR